MNIPIDSIKSFYIRNKRLILILTIIILTDFAIHLNVPIFRQFLGFILLYFVSGAIILYAMKLKRLNIIDIYILSIGLSISFLMFSGLFISILYPLLGYNMPLSTESLVITLSLFLILCILASLKYQSITLAEPNILTLNIREKALLLLPSIFPMMAITGIYLMNLMNNNIILIILFLLMVGYIIFITVTHDHIPNNAYPLIIFLCSISLMLIYVLRSDHIIGIDSHLEYYYFQQNFHSGRWQLLMNRTLNSCLSISVLPTAYQSILDINPEFLFKILYPIFFSVLPLAVYSISSKFIGEFWAFLAAIFFVSQSSFLDSLYNSRTTVAILFFAISIMILFNSNLDEFKRKLIFIILVASCIVSHYSTTYIFILILLIFWLCMKLISMTSPFKWRPFLLQAQSSGFNHLQLKTQKYLSMSNITSGSIVLFSAIVFLWYSQITKAPFDSGVNFIGRAIWSLQDLFIMEARSEGMIRALTIENKSIPQIITIIISWINVIFIAIGVIITIYKCRYRVALNDGNLSSSIYQKFNIDFLMLSIVCSATLVIALAIPYIFKGYGMGRAYLQMMVVLSPYFVVGGTTVADYLHFRWRPLIILVVIIVNFMCSTGVTHQIFGEAHEIILNSEGDSYDMLFIHDQDTLGAKWLKHYASQNISIYADFLSDTKLMSQGGLLSAKYPRTFIENGGRLGKGYFYLRYINTVDGKLLDAHRKWHNIIDYKEKFFYKNLIYNSGSKVLI